MGRLPLLFAAHGKLDFNRGKEACAVSLAACSLAMSLAISCLWKGNTCGWMLLMPIPLSNTSRVLKKIKPVWTLGAQTFQRPDEACFHPCGCPFSGERVPSGLPGFCLWGQVFFGRVTWVASIRISQETSWIRASGTPIFGFGVQKPHLPPAIPRRLPNGPLLEDSGSHGIRRPSERPWFGSVGRCSQVSA